MQWTIVDGEHPHLIAKMNITINHIEVLKCMCGNTYCKYCSNKIHAHGGQLCPHCGFPVNIKFINDYEKPKN